MNHGSQEEAKAELLGFLSRLLQEKFYLCFSQANGTYQAQALGQTIKKVFSYYLLEDKENQRSTEDCSLAICNLLNRDISHYLVAHSSHSIYWIDIKIYQQRIAEKMMQIREKQKYF